MIGAGFEPRTRLGPTQTPRRCFAWLENCAAVKVVSSGSKAACNTHRGCRVRASTRLVFPWARAG